MDISLAASSSAAGLVVTGDFYFLMTGFIFSHVENPVTRQDFSEFYEKISCRAAGRLGRKKEILPGCRPARPQKINPAGKWTRFRRAKRAGGFLGVLQFILRQKLGEVPLIWTHSYIGSRGGREGGGGSA